ncbi:MAG: universal stress protein [Desulfobacca sp.]|uniref:universal stress protein n=1 Tax=Desulfobacca sp. TaxID=2067990 RepID=UPI0040496093
MFKKILVPLDGSELAAKILPKVEELAKLCDAQVTLVSVSAEATDVPGDPSPEIFQKAAAYEKQACQTYLGNTAKDLQNKGLKVDVACLEGVAAREIVRYAAEGNFDLIALATHGRGEVAWVIGSTAEKILSHATVPVLLFRVLEYKPPLLKEEFFLGA